MTSDRIQALETVVAHQEAAIEDLSETVQAQWAEIERLTRELGKLTRSLEALVEDAGDAPPANQRPPHY